MGCVRLFIRGEDGGELGGVETETVDDFHYFRDSVHAALETGGFGSRFPTFMLRFEDGEWSAQELGLLHEELTAIAEAFKKMPPEPFDGNWERKLGLSGRRCPSLYEVYVDAAGKPLLGALLDLCDAARKAGKAIAIR